jgi:hypothetical protein
MKVVRVVVKYKSAQMADWDVIELNKMGSAWGGLLPCDVVTLGAMQYWLQGFDQRGEPVALSGDPKNPYTVPIRDEISSEPPHLPGKPAPLTCSESDRERARRKRTQEARQESREDDSEHVRRRASDDDSSTKSEPVKSDTEGEGDTDKPKRHAKQEYATLWLGVAGAVDLLSFPAGDDVCKLGPTNGQPLNPSNIYCTAADGGDFPPRTPQGQMQNAALVPGQSGTTPGGLLGGDVRLMLTLDYAVDPSVLIGGRFGYVLNAYTGQAAVTAGRAFGAKFHLEARATYLFGRNPLTTPGFAPMVLGGLGVSEFDGHVTTVVKQNNVQGETPVDAWKTDGPFFLLLGGGARYQFSLRAAFTAALRVNVVLGGGGILFTYGPEIGVQYGF